MDPALDANEPELVNRKVERNWFQKTFNMGGPGWFHDVFEIELFLDAEKVVRDERDFFVKPYSTAGEIPTFQPCDKITGTVRLTAPPGKAAFCSKIEINIEEFIMEYSMHTSIELKTHTVVVPGTEQGLMLEEAAEFPFEIDLAELDSGEDIKPWKDTYTGQQFALRHFLTATAHRPWWTYECETRTPVHIQRVCAAPAADAGNDRNLQQLPPVDAPIARHVMPLVDVDTDPAKKGICFLNFNKTNFNVEESFSASFYVRGLRTPIKDVTFELFKVEYGDDDAWDRVMYRQKLYPPGPAELHPPEPELDADGNVIPATVEVDAEGGAVGAEGVELSEKEEIAPLSTDRELSVHFPFSDLGVGHCKFDISATQPIYFIDESLDYEESVKLIENPRAHGLTDDQEGDEADEDDVEAPKLPAHISVRYFIRVTVEQVDGGKKWNTNEIKLYRSQMRWTTKIDDAEL